MFIVFIIGEEKLKYLLVEEAKYQTLKLTAKRQVRHVADGKDEYCLVSLLERKSIFVFLIFEPFLLW